MSALSGIDIALWDLKGTAHARRRPCGDCPWTRPMYYRLTEFREEIGCAGLGVIRRESERENKSIRLDRRRPTL